MADIKKVNMSELARQYRASEISSKDGYDKAAKILKKTDFKPSWGVAWAKAAKQNNSGAKKKTAGKEAEPVANPWAVFAQNHSEDVAEILTRKLSEFGVKKKKIDDVAGALEIFNDLSEVEKRRSELLEKLNELA